MINEIPQYGLRAYALFFSKHDSIEPFTQKELDWILSDSMKKKVFSLLLNNGWIKKQSYNSYTCISPEIIFKNLLNFKIPELIKKSEKSYSFTNLSAVEMWSDYSYVQRGIDKSPYLNEGSTIGEYVILIPRNRIKYVNKDGLKVISLKETLNIAKENKMHLYAYNYMKNKYGKTSA